MGVTVVIFIIMAVFYKYVYFEEIDREREKKRAEDKDAAELESTVMAYPASGPKAIPELPGYVPFAGVPVLNEGLPKKPGMEIYNNVNPAFVDDSTKM